MVLLDICDFPLSDDRSWKFWHSTAQWSKHHTQAIKLVRPIPVLIFTAVFVSELFVLEGLMYYTPQSVKIWE